MPGSLAGELKVTVLRARKLKGENAVFVLCNVTGIDETKRTAAAINAGEGPVFNESYKFPSVRKDQDLTIEVIDKDVGREVSAGAVRLRSSAWGTKGRPFEEWVGVLNSENKYGGDVLLQVEWDCVLRFKMPFSLVAKAADTTCSLTAPLQRYIEAAVNVLVGVTSVPISVVQSIWFKLSQWQRLLLLAVLLGILLFVGTVTTICVGGPALFFFPITIFLSFCAAGVAIVVVPILLVIGWVILCSKPVQARFVKPTVVHVLSAIPTLQDYVLAAK